LRVLGKPWENTFQEKYKTLQSQTDLFRFSVFLAQASLHEPEQKNCRSATET
jgi:hypothetical protein